MSTPVSIDPQYVCDNDARRAKVAASASWNAIEYLEVLDRRAPAGIPPQQTLLVRCYRPVPAGMTRANVRLQGGVRVTGIGVVWAFPGSALVAGTAPTAVVSSAEQALLGTFLQNVFPADPATVLVVRTDARGDASKYRLTLVPDPPSGAELPFDIPLSHVDFGFKVECASDLDCETNAVCAPVAVVEPEIDYQAKDYNSFRRLMLDRLSTIAPEWRERNVADLGVVLVEILALAGDHLSYFQDAVANEAYLGTARRRVSVRRHARLLDYFMSDGCNARAWVRVPVTKGSGADGMTLPGPRTSAAGVSLRVGGTQFLTRVDGQRGAYDPLHVADALAAGAQVFETLHPVALRSAHSEIHFYTWGDDDCCLPAGACQATLDNTGNALQFLRATGPGVSGDVLILAEARGQTSGLSDDADTARRHAVRLTAVTFATDPLYSEDAAGTQPQRVAQIAWDPADAPPFPLCLRAVGGQPVSVAWGNVVLVDHGRTVGPPVDAPEVLPRPSPTELFRPTLKLGPVTQQASVNLSAPAASAMSWQMADVTPAIWLSDPSLPDQPWLPQPDLLESDPFATEFVVETEDDQTTQLRFGDGVLGQKPASALTASYRTGNGTAGNVGAGAIAHLVSVVDGIGQELSNPMPAQGGVAPESIEDVRQFAPQAFRTQDRAVTEADWATVASRYGDVRKVVATRRWTGSWTTVFLSVDRQGGRTVDAAFKAGVSAFLDRYRLAGYDLEVEGPIYVPLDIALSVCVADGYFRADVKQALLEVFSNRDLPDGRRGFFHPDNFTFGQTVYLSRVVAAAMSVPGVVWVDSTETAPLHRFQRYGGPDTGDAEELPIARLEIARLDNDVNDPENGRFELQMMGGL